jgi:hypothetical protein
MRALVFVFAAAAVGAITVTTLPRPPFPGPVTSAPAATHLVVVSSRPIAPGLGGRAPSCQGVGLPETPPVRGLPLQRAICPGGPPFALYGRDGASARILVGQDPAFDFKNYVRPPRIRPAEREFVYEQIVWAREADGVLYVENAHSTYAKSSYGQNAYITAIDLKTKQRLWRSRALVANANTFVLTPHYIVAGYGFTAEPDFLYLLDRRDGRVVERLLLPSGPERITRQGNRLTVRTYDHVVVVRLQES